MVQSALAAMHPLSLRIEEWLELGATSVADVELMIGDLLEAARVEVITRRQLEHLVIKLWIESADDMWRGDGEWAAIELILRGIATEIAGKKAYEAAWPEVQCRCARRYADAAANAVFDLWDATYGPAGTMDWIEYQFRPDNPRLRAYPKTAQPIKWALVRFWNRALHEQGVDRSVLAHLEEHYRHLAPMLQKRRVFLGPFDLETFFAKSSYSALPHWREFIDSVLGRASHETSGDELRDIFQDLGLHGHDVIPPHELEMFIEEAIRLLNGG
jgi:hypothetical protein